MKIDWCRHVIQQRLKELMDERGKSLYRLALDTGLTEMTLRNLRNNKTNSISFNVLERICRALNCTPNDLLVMTDKAITSDNL